MIIISPTKTMELNQEAVYAEPFFKDESEILKNIIKSLSKEELAKTMKIQNKTLDQTFDYYHEQFKLQPAIFSYKGMAFKELEYQFNKQFAHENVVILSGLYGGLKAMDGIVPYRLDFTMKQIFEFNLYSYWQEKVTNFLNEFPGTQILSLASKEYQKIINKDMLKKDLIELEFNKKAHSTTLKKVRGQILNLILNKQIIDYNDLIGMETELMLIKSLEHNQLKIILK